MAFLHVGMGPPAFLPTTTGSIYANPTGKKTLVKGLLIHNTNTTTETVKVWLVPASGTSLGTPTDVGRIVNIGLPANDSLIVELPGYHTMASLNDSIQGITTTASKVTVHFFGDQE